MIIGRRERIHDVAAFKAGLDAAAEGVVRVSVLPDRGAAAASFASGWLITETLVVVPDFVVHSEFGRSFSCEQGERAVAAELELGVTGDPDGSRPALLRLAEPLGRPLTLAAEAAETGDEVFVLQHPEGKPHVHLSFGRLVAGAEPWLSYDADTRGGSSGAAVLSSDWTIIAMHTRAAIDESATNHGVPITALLAHLRECPAWAEIAEQHRLADVGAIRRVLEEPTTGAAPPGDGADLLPAAVRWSFDPATLPPDAVEQLRPLVAESSASRWTLPAGARASLLQSAGSLDALREARGSEESTHPGQQVIDRILGGPPYSLDDVPEQALPYWLQATRWFAGVVPSLPTPAEVNRTLERRRMRSRLEQIGGPGFRGRAAELDVLREWHRDDAAGPMVITGIGGVGKSALVAHFALELPERTLQLWLDFDRADVAPDDAVSVLRLLFDQLTTQLDGFGAPALDTASWAEAVASLGPALAPHMNGAPAPLLVLDGFEVAQHFKEHREIWRLLEELLPQVPGLRVLVSGRAPVGDLELGGRSVRGLHLAGLSDPDASAWLRDAGIGDEGVVARVVEITHGVPLALRLAVRWAETGGDVAELPEELPERLVDGFLYDRILDRVIDPLLKPVAQDALVLRRVTPEMIPAVLRDSLPEGLEPAEVFERLAQEMALVGDDAQESPAVAVSGGGVLRLRPEVRSATLRLLETDRAHRVRKIDERAANWYAAQDTDDVATAAELVYHRLRLGDVPGAARAWRDGCAPLLMYADEELPVHADAARKWLRDRTHVAPTATNVQEAWERDALVRVRALIARGVVQALGPLLAERAERSPGSPLVVYDAWLRWAVANDAAGARELLAAAGAAEGEVARARAVLAAWLAAWAGDRDEADRQLVELADAARWTERPEPELDALTVEAARVRLTIDVATELAVAEEPEAAEELLPPTDVVTPFLAERLGGAAALESTGPGLHIPREASDLEAFAAELDRIRGPGAVLPLLDDVDITRFRTDVRPVHRDAVELAILGWKRWRLVTAGLFLARACEELNRAKPGETQRLAIVGTLAAFATSERSPLTLVYDFVPLERFLLTSDAPFAIREVPGTSQREKELMTNDRVRDAFLRGPEILSMYLLSPDPLEQLVRGVLGIPDHLSLRGVH